MKHLVTGACGMIGSHLVRRLVQDGQDVVGIDNLSAGTEANVKDIRNEFELIIGDCRDFRQVSELVKGRDRVWTLAANMGGIMLITRVHADVVYDNSLINLNVIKACQLHDVERLFYASSACIYPNYKQTTPDVEGLKESDAFPADANEVYGWEKLFTEKVCESFIEDYEQNIRIARFHNVFGGAFNAYDSIRGKAPAHMIIKAIKHPNPPYVIWGDGKQTRSFLYIDDCIDGILKLMDGNYNKPVNIGSDRLINMTDLAKIAVSFTGKKVDFKYDLTKPQGVRGRNSNNELVKKVLGWSPKISLEDGMERTYDFAVKHYNELEGI
jgi:nucleoside-diphosphate-sugar epimerase